MLTNPTPSRRLAGKAVILGALAIALPLTATWATRYVDVTAPEAPTPSTPPTPAAAPEAWMPALAPMPAAAPLPPVPPQPPVTRRLRNGDADISFIGEESVRINGTTKRWNELTSSERAQIRRDTTKARQELDEQMAELPRQLAEARREIASSRSEHRRELAEARIEIARALAEVDANAAHIRAAGQDPAQIREQVRASLRHVEQMDIDKVVREAMAAADPDRINAEMRKAQASLERVQARLDQLDRN